MVYLKKKIKIFIIKYFHKPNHYYEYGIISISVCVYFVCFSFCIRKKFNFSNKNVQVYSVSTYKKKVSWVKVVTNVHFRLIKITHYNLLETIWGIKKNFYVSLQTVHIRNIVMLYFFFWKQWIEQLYFVHIVLYLIGPYLYFHTISKL